MNTEHAIENIFSYLKMHYGETILAKTWKLEKTMIKGECKKYSKT